MSHRQAIGLAALLCVSAGWWPAAATAASQTMAPKQSLVFPVTLAAAGAGPRSVECVVDFGPALPIAALAFSPDDKTLAVGGYQEVLLWDLAGARLAKRVGGGYLHGMVHAVAFLDAGKALAVGDGVPYQSGAVTVLDIETGKPTARFDQPRGPVECLAVSPDGKRLAAGGADSLVWVWNLATAKLVKTIDAHHDRVLGVAFSSDGKRLATAGADHTLRVWDAGTWEPLVRYDLPATAHAVALSPDAKIVVAAVGGPGEWALRVGRIDSDLQQAARRKPTARPISTGTGMPLDVVWPAKGANVFVACNDHTVRAYRAANRRVAATFNGHTDWVYCVAATADGTRLASGSADGTVKLWRATGGKPLATLIQLSPGTEDWAIVTPQGYFTASSTDALRWKPAGSSAPPKELPSRYHNAELVRKALAATAPPGFRRKGRAKSRRYNRSPQGPARKKVK